MAPRNPMADRAKHAPADSPSAVGRQPPPDAPPNVPPFSDITMTPAVAITMAAAIMGLTASPRNTRPNSATCTGSVLIYAMVTTKDRSPMAASMSAVAAIWASAPSSSHGQKLSVGCGSAPPTASIPSRNTSANGKPNRNRT